MACVSHTCNCYAAAVAAIASRSFENLCKRILGAVAALAVANDNDDDIERKYIKFVRNVYSLWSRSLGKMLIFRSRSFSSLDCVLFGGVLCVCAFVCAKRDVNPFRIFFLLLSFPFICVFSQSPSLSFFAMLCAVGRCSFDIFVRIIIIQNANEGYFCRNVFRCLLRPLARAASLLIRCSFVQTSDMLLCILMRIRGTWRVCALSAYYVFCFCVCECDAPTVTAKWKYVLRNGFGLVQMRVLVILGVEIRHTFKQKLFIYVLLFFFCGCDRNAFALSPSSRFKWNIIATKLYESHRRGIQDRCEEYAAWRSKCIHFESECVCGGHHRFGCGDWLKCLATIKTKLLSQTDNRRWRHYIDAEWVATAAHPNAFCDRIIIIIIIGAKCNGLRGTHTYGIIVQWICRVILGKTADTSSI